MSLTFSHFPLFVEPYQNVFVHGQGCQAGGASLVFAPARASDGHAEAGSAHHQCKWHILFTETLCL